jgi:hypothetical protein
MDYLPGEDHTIDKPEEYEFWRDYVPQLRPPWPGKLLSWSMSDPITLKVRSVTFDPLAAGPTPGKLNLWIYRRIANKRNFEPGTYLSDITLVNWPQNDYWLGNLHEVSPEEAARHLKRAKQLSLSLLYWMQTEARRSTPISASLAASWPSSRCSSSTWGRKPGRSSRARNPRS